MSLEDDLVSAFAGHIQRWLAIAAGRRVTLLTPLIGRFVVRRAQRAAERRHSRMRRDLLKVDERLESALAFAGRPE